MSVTIPIIAADGSKSTVVLPDPVVAGTLQMLTTLATSDYAYPTGSAYQPSGSPWWAFMNAESGGPAGEFNIQYDPANFPNHTIISWNGPKFSYPEIIIGAQGPNHNDYVFGPNGTKGGQSSTPPAWLPAWFNKPLSALKSIVFTWDITYNANNNNNFDTLCETWLGPAGTAGEPPYETALVLKDPGWWAGKAKFQATINGVSYYFIPAGEPTSPKSLTIIPASVYAPGTPWLNGSIDLLPILSYAASQGWTSMGYTLCGWEFGNEIGDASAMTGSVTWNSLNFTVT